MASLHDKPETLRVVLISSITTSGEHDSYAVDFAQAKLSESLGIAYLQAFIGEQRGRVDVVALNPFLDGLTAASAARRAVDEKPLLIGVSLVHQWHRNFALELASQIKRIAPSVHVVAGGVFPTSDWAGMLHRAGGTIDSICRGEGENTLIELIDHLERGTDWRQTPGLAYLRDGQPTSNPSRPRIVDLERLPYPSRASLKTAVESGGVIQVEGSRGCNSSCEFCDIRHTGWIPRPADHLLGEIDLLIREYPDVPLWFIDNIFIGFGSRRFQRVAEFVDGVERRGLDFRFSFQDRAENMQPDVLSSLKRAGLNTLYVGVESFADPALVRWQKGASAKINRKALDAIASLEIPCHIGLIFFDGSSTEDEIRDNLDAMDEIAQAGPFIHLHNLNELIPYSGTFLERKYIDRGWLSDAGLNVPVAPVVATFKRWAWEYLDRTWPITQVMFALFDDVGAREYLLPLVQAKNAELVRYLQALFRAASGRTEAGDLVGLCQRHVGATLHALSGALAVTPPGRYHTALEHGLDMSTQRATIVPAQPV